MCGCGVSVQNRIDWIDYAKGIGIILVVYGHVLRGMIMASIPCSTTYFLLSDRAVYGFHMPLFFVLSGLFAEKWLLNNSLSHAIESRVSRLLRPYAIVYLLHGGLNVLFSKYTNIGLTWTGLVLGMLFQPYQHFWFVYVLFFISMAYLLIRIGFRLPPLVVLGISLIMYFSAPYVHLWVLPNIFSFMLFFCIGGVIGHKQMTDVVSNLAKPLWLLCLTCAFVLLNAYYNSFLHGQTNALLLALTGTALVSAVSYLLADKKLSGVFQYLGTLSLPIYLFHTIFSAACRIFLLNTCHVNSVWAHIPLDTLAGLVCPALLYQMILKANLKTFVFGQ